MPEFVQSVPPIDTEAMPQADATLSSRYLALIAGVAGWLLAADTRDTLVDDLFELIRSELRLDVFVNYRLENGRLVLEAHGGLTAEQAEALATLELGQAVCGCVARDGKPLYAGAVQASSDEMTSFIRGIGLDSYACTPLMYGDRLIGTLSFGRRWSDRFTGEELSFLHTVCHYVGFAKHRRETEAALREEMMARDRLLSELNHRVRNALQLAISVLQIDAGGASDPAAHDAYRRAAERVTALATAHRPLYADSAPAQVDLRSLLQQMIEQRTGETAEVICDRPHSASVERSAALALFTDEVFARCGVSDSLRGELREEADGRLTLAFSGFTDPGCIDGGRMSRAMTALARQLRASVRAGDGRLEIGVSL